MEAFSWLWEAKIQLSIFIIAISWCIWVRKKQLHKLPPGPPGLPIVGNIPFIDPELHKYFAKLTNKYGPIFKLRLGSRLLIVLGSPELAAVVMKELDSTFANRAPTVAAMTIGYNGSDMVFADYGPHLRNVRALCVREILSKSALDSFSALRQQEVRRCLRSLYAKVNTPVNIREEMFLIMLNVIMNMMWGGTFNDEEKTKIGLEFRKRAEEVLDYLGRTNISDFLPVLARFDLQGVERRLKELISWLDPFFESMIDQRIKLDREIKLNGDQDGYQENKVKDFLQVFQQLQDQGESKVPFTFTNLKALFMNLVVGGTDTAGGAVEWAMAELIKEPKIMKRALEELDNVVGKNNIVEESHIPNLPYLGAIIKETYRLHPGVPLLVSRCPSSTCNVGGYVIPKGAQVLMNAWAIQRDPKYWDNPLEFQPERFLQTTSKFDFIGTDFRYIPFGSGRRRCIGIPLVERIVPYALASLLHSFEWRMPEGVEVDLSEKFGIVLKTGTPLTAIPLPRLSDSNLYALC
ncbi:hypothetical protein MKX03_005657 [Papaver bracteatum]|nr:hypothetical protein MKX03_005657 [Papaver bracteatum]